MFVKNRFPYLFWLDFDDQNIENMGHQTEASNIIAIILLKIFICFDFERSRVLSLPTKAHR